VGGCSSVRGSLTNRGLAWALLRAVLVAFALLLAYRFLAAVATTMLLLATGLLLAVALSAPVEALHRRKVPRPVSVAVIFLMGVALLCAAGYLLFPVLAKQASQLSSALPTSLSQLVERASEVARDLGINVGGGGGGISPSTLARGAQRVLGGAVGLLGGLASFFAALIILLFVPLYLAAMPGPVVGWVVRLFPPGKREETRELLCQARTRLLHWLGGQLFSMAVIGTLSTAALYLIGVPGALFLGIFTGLVCFIPLVGPVVSALPPLVLAFAGSPIDALWVLLAYVAIQQVESNLLTPLVMRQAVSLHPAIVIATVTVAGTAFGILGTLLAVPAMVVVGVLVDEVWFRRLEEPGGRSEQTG
jgi:predicted PurR-regulated permease PerM